MTEHQPTGRHIERELEIVEWLNIGGVGGGIGERQKILPARGHDACQQQQQSLRNIRDGKTRGDRESAIDRRQKNKQPQRYGLR